MSTFLNIIKSILSIGLMLLRYAFYRAISSLLTGFLLLFIATLMFATFYQSYMPVVSHIKPVYLQFSSDCHGESTALCSFPEASVFFTSTNKANEGRMLMRGQAYKVFLDLEMPPSPTNEKLGMFMVNVKFLSAKGTVLKSSSRSCMLHYESYLVRLFKTIFYSLPLTLGITEEKQKVELNFFEDYIDDSYNPAVQAKVVIMTKQIEIYSSTLRFQASFTGFRYLIFNWPVLFSFLGIVFNFLLLSLIYSASLNQFTPSTSTKSTTTTTATTTTTNSVIRQQHVGSVQQRNGASQMCNGRVSTAATTIPVEGVEPVCSTVETVTSTAPIPSQLVQDDVASVSSEATKPQHIHDSSVKCTATTTRVDDVEPITTSVETFSAQTPSQPVQEDMASTSSEVKTQRYTRVSSVKYKLYRKQHKVSHTGPKQIRKYRVMRPGITDAVHEISDNDDIIESGADQAKEAICNAIGSNDDWKDIPVRQTVGDVSLLSDGHLMANTCSPTRVVHLRKRRKTDDDNKKPRKQTVPSKNTMLKLVRKEVITNNSRNHKTAETRSSCQTESQSHFKSLWGGFCFAKDPENFRLARIRRLGMHLQEAMPSLPKTIRHCVSNLELSSAEEKRLNESISPKRSVSADDITSLNSEAAILSEIYQ